MAKKRIAYIKERNGYLYLHFTERGKRRRESLGLKATRDNKNLANSIAVNKEASIMRGMYEVGRFMPITVIEAMESFKMSKKLKKNSLGVYNSAFTEFCKIIGGDKKVSEITAADVAKFHEELKIKRFEQKPDETEEEKKKRLATPPKLRSENTISTYNNHLKILFDYLIEKNFITQNPFKHIEGKKNLIVTISDDDFEKIIKYFSANKRDDQQEAPEAVQARKEQLRFIKFLQLTGFRTGEAVNLKWENIDYARDLIMVRNEKENRDDYVALIPEIKELLTGTRKRSGKVFSYSEDGLKFFPRAMKKLGFKYCLHDIRRTFGTKLANAGMRPLDLMAAMRHKNIKTTMKYYINMDIQRIGGLISDTFKRPLDLTTAAEEIDVKTVKNKPDHP